MGIWIALAVFVLGCVVGAKWASGGQVKAVLILVAGLLVVAQILRWMAVDGQADAGMLVLIYSALMILPAALGLGFGALVAHLVKRTRQRQGEDA